MTPGIHLATVAENRSLGGDAYLLRVHQPELAAGFRPGQFVGVRVSERGSWDPLLRRPMSVARSSGGSRATPGEHIDLLHVVVGRGTRAMADLEPGAEVDLLGPLGNSFFDERFDLLRAGRRIVIAAGGVGVAPFLGVASWLVEAGRGEQVVFLFGARSEAALCGRSELEELPVRVELATDDGSAGRRGFVTELLEEVLAESRDVDTIVLCCGPEPMMEATARVATAAGAECLVSLENVMACGIGACYGCVVLEPERDGRAARYSRACVEGPIYPSSRLGW